MITRSNLSFDPMTARAGPANAVVAAAEAVATRNSRRLPLATRLLAEDGDSAASSTAFSNAVNAASIASCGRSWVMNTIRVRRSSLGHCGSSTGG